MKIFLKRVSGYTMTSLVVLASCVGLDVTPTDKFTDETYWTTPERAASLLNMAYRQMNDPGRVFRDERLSDNLYNGYGNDDVRVIANGQATASTALFDNFWGDAYAGIKTTHTFLANVDRVGMDEGLASRMKAEARFIRAFLYFQLTNWYGDVPFFTEDIDLETARTIRPTPQAEIISWIHSELEEIAEILPSKEEYSAADRGRITSGAAVALNARVALNFNDWSRVKTYTEKLINTNDYGQYALFPNYGELFYKVNEYNDEIILDIQYVPVDRTWNEIAVYVPFSLPLVEFTLASPTQGLVDTYLMKDGSKWDETKHAYENRDPRMDMTIARHGSTVRRKDGSSYTINVDPNDPNNNSLDRIGRENGGYTGYFYRKYYDPNPEAWTAGSTWSCNINFITLRYADVLLMYAEAMNELGEMDAAVWDKTIRLLRQRAGLDDTPLALDFPSAGDLRQIIRDERRVELALEGTRVYDIRRWKIAETVMNAPFRGAKFDRSSGTLDYFSYEHNSFNADRDYFWAIPRQQLTINNNLGQNPGY
ncbi:Starch-binding associating with outer membrane [Parapedobacter composti]|uniref:Starch-binding associating with outer membrane n=1 Tax=Parapedobacter composti TaxID=623281 RepID=A0A1I1F4X7_9SPHI|nr:RagB/SusD family nutrient uptake outer membrane protein [Parapedobacter composti]SFB94341.1 Starch-binding associating with outer membrane [Parapedobacter composti]